MSPQSLWPAVAILSVSLWPLAAAAAAPPAVNQTVLKATPIVIETQQQQYEQPTLQEYTECHMNLDKCRETCATSHNRVACESECPVCPILTEQQVVVQGINDTDYRAPALKPLNTTNIVRVTNEIRNLIESQSTFEAINQNNIHVHHNISTTGGRFGLGYNEHGSCCIVLRPVHNCTAGSRRPHAHSKAPHCRPKRHRVCGEKCKERYMRATRVTYCTEDGEDCQQRLEYVPYKRQPRPSRAHTACQYTPHWPFVVCPRHSRMPSLRQCSRCFALPYIYILQNGMPMQCRRCYGVNPFALPYAPPPMWGPYPVYRPYQRHPRPPSFGGFDEFDLEPGFMPTDDQGWRVEKTKCRTPEGHIIDNCPHHGGGVGESDEGSGMGPIEDPLEPHLPESEHDEDDYEGDYDDWDREPTFEDGSLEEAFGRRRRHTFKRSKYSRRHHPLAS